MAGYHGADRSLGGADRIRTGDPLLAKQMLYQLSYDPRQGLYSAVQKNISPEIYFVRSTETHPPWSSLRQTSVDFDHRRDHLRDVAVSLERR